LLKKRKEAMSMNSVLERLELPYEIMVNCKLSPNRKFALSLSPKGGL
jgi:hypothetical protein